MIISALDPAGTISGIASGNAFTNDFAFFGNGWAHLISSSAGTYGAQWNATAGSFASSTVSFKAAGSASGGTLSACDLNQDGLVNVIDVQLVTDMYLGVIPCAANIVGNGICSTLTVQQVQNAALGGTCVVAGGHTVTLNWTASTTPNVNYNVYRSVISGGPYTKLTSNVVGALTFVDSSVLAGQAYYYVTTSIDGTGNESANSNQAPATVPFP